MKKLSTSSLLPSGEIPPPGRYGSSIALQMLEARRQARAERDRLRPQAVVKPAPVKPRRTNLPPMADFVHETTPKWMPPRHLQKLLDRLDGIIRGERHNLLVSIPPRHSKTESLLHFIAKCLLVHPDWTLGYASYQQGIAESKSSLARGYARASGSVLAKDLLAEWRTVEGGGLLAAGVGGPWTGQGIQVGVIDDPVKNRATAESPTSREAVWRWFQNDIMSRIEVGGSVIVCMARWHHDDLTGRIQNEYGDLFETIHMPALDEDEFGEDTIPLWPERWTLEELQLKRRIVGPYAWASLYQGKPRPSGGTVFNEAKLYKAADLPQQFRIGQGIDLAYTEKKASDYNALVTFKKAIKGGYYLIPSGMLHMHARPTDFKLALKKKTDLFPGARRRFYGSGLELGAAGYLIKNTTQVGSDRISNLDLIAATADKFVRSMSYAATWNREDDSSVFVPEDYDPTTAEGEMIDSFIAQHSVFTGQGDPEDDWIDAAAAAHDVADGGKIDWATAEANKGKSRLEAPERDSTDLFRRGYRDLPPDRRGER